MAVITSKIARIRFGPSARNKTTVYTATRVTGPTGNPPEYSKEIIQFTDPKGSDPVVIATQDSSNSGKLIFNSNASAAIQQNQNLISKASTTQVNSVKNAIAFTAQEKQALNSISGSNNAAVNSGTDSSRPAGQTKSEARRSWDSDFGEGQRDDFDASTEGVNTNDDVTSQESVTSEAASGTRNSFDTLLVYPTTLREENQDTIHFTMMEYVAKKLGPSNGLLVAGERTANRNPIGRVVLPIPGGINDQNNCGWQSGEMSAGQMATAQLALEGITKGLTAMGEKATDMLGDIGANSKDVGDALAQTIAGAATGDSKALMQRASGQVMNPNMELLFNGPQLRQFSFTFNFTARSAAEGRTILRILRFFKQGMSPIKSESNLFLKSPHTFRLQYKKGSNDHKALNRFKECALTSCGIQYTPDGNYATFEDGIMTKYQMTLAFGELEPVFNSDYAEFSQDQIGF